MSNNISYLCFNGNDFTNFIAFVKSMNTRNSKTAVLHIEDGKLVCRAIDDLSAIIEFYVELYDHENQITEPISVSITDLSALIKSAYSNKFTIRKCFGQFEFNIVGNGWMPFKASDGDLSKFVIDGVESDVGNINSTKLKNAIQSVLGYTQDYTYVRDKYIQFNNNQMVVTSRLASVVTSDTFVEMTIRRDVAAMLKSLLKDEFTLEIKRVDSAIERLLFCGEKFKLCVVADSVESNNITYNNNLNEYITVDCDELYKLVLFSEEYSVSKHIIGMSIKDTKLNVSIKNVLAAKHSSVITSTVTGDVKDTSKEAEISSHNLLKALKLFQDKRSRNVNIYINDGILNEQNSIIMFDNNTQAIINVNR